MFAARRSPLSLPLSDPSEPPSGRRAAGRAVLCLAVLCAAAPAACGQNTLPTPGELRAAGLEMAWWAVAAVPAGRGRVTNLSADEDAVYVQTNSNLLTAIDLTSGAKKWTTRTGRAGQTAAPVGTAPGLVVAAVGRVVYGIEKDSGETVWELPLPESAAAAPTIGETQEGRRLFVPTQAGSVYSYDLTAIEEYYLEKRLPEFATGTQRWRYETGSPLAGPVLIDGIAAVFANERGVLYGVDAEKRELLWRFETDGRTSAPVVAADGVAYLPSTDRNLYAVNIENGLDRWEFVSKDPIEVEPAIVQGALYVTPARSGVDRVDRDTGRPIWRAPRMTGFLAQAADRAYVSDGADNVIALNVSDGRRIGSVRLNLYSERMQNALTDRVILSSPNGIVICLKAAGAGFPVYFRNPDRRPVELEFADDAADAPAEGRPAAE